MREKGIGRNDIVAIMVERSVEMIVGILGILKAGAYLPIDTLFPQNRVLSILNDSKASVLLLADGVDFVKGGEKLLRKEFNREIILIDYLFCDKSIR